MNNLNECLCTKCFNAQACKIGIVQKENKRIIQQNKDLQKELRNFTKKGIVRGCDSAIRILNKYLET